MVPVQLEKFKNANVENMRGNVVLLNILLISLLLKSLGSVAGEAFAAA